MNYGILIPLAMCFVTAVYFVHVNRISYERKIKTMCDDCTETTSPSNNIRRGVIEVCSGDFLRPNYLLVTLKNVRLDYSTKGYIDVGGEEYSGEVIENGEPTVFILRDENDNILNIGIIGDEYGFHLGDRYLSIDNMVFITLHKSRIPVRAAA